MTKNHNNRHIKRHTAKSHDKKQKLRTKLQQTQLQMQKPEQAWLFFESEFLIENQTAIACHAWDGYQRLGRGCVALCRSKCKELDGVRLDFLPLSQFATVPECKNLRTAAETYDPSTQVVVWLINSAKHISDVYTLTPKSSPSECFNSLSQQWDEFGYEMAAGGAS